MNNDPPKEMEHADTDAIAWWTDRARLFSTALRAPEEAVPPEIGKTNNQPSLKRFNVYRNNVASSLRSAMAATYPVVEALVGAEFFAPMAQAYVADNIPSSPVLLEYGESFAEFLERFEPVRQLGYLPDVARVEWAFNESFHAKDAEPITIKALSALDPQALEYVRFALHPSLRLTRSSWPVLSIWQAHQQDDPAAHMEKIAGPRQGEAGFVVRPKFEVTATIVPVAAVDFLTELSNGKTLTQAADVITEAEQADMGAMLATLFEAGLVAGLMPLDNNT